MECLSIGIADEIEEIKNLIDDTVLEFKSKEILIELKHKTTNDMNFIDIIIQPDNKLNSIKVYIASVISQYIIEKYEKTFINRIINTNYCYFNAVERKEILKTAVNNIIGKDDQNIFNNLFMLRRKNIITKKIIEYLETSNEILLDGFVTFRLKDYMKELEDVVDKAVDDYLMEKEYKEFIRLLKYFVEIQEPKLDVVHVVGGYNNKYALLDEYGKEITNECIKDFVNEVSEGEINYDDLLVSSLITLAPNKIYIHKAKHIQNKELIETIGNVFIGKVVFCEGCELCLNHKVSIMDTTMTDYVQK